MSRTLVNAPEQVTGAPQNLSFPIGNTITNGTSNSVLFVDANGKLGQDNSNLFYDAANKRLGVDTTFPTGIFQVGLTFSTTATGVGVGILTPQSVFQVKAASGVDLIVSAGVTDATAVALRAVNDAASSVVPMEFRASTFNFATGNVGVANSSPTSLFQVGSGPLTVNASGGVTNVGVVTTNGLTLSSQGSVQFSDATNTNKVGFKAPSSVTTSVTWVLPAGDGTTGQFLKTDGSGTLSWAAGSGGGSIGGTITGGVSGSILYIDGSGNMMQQNSLLYFDPTSYKAGFGTSSPAARLSSVVGTTGAMVGLLVEQADTSISPNAVKVTSSNTASAIYVAQTGNTPVGDTAGAIFVDGTTNTGVSINAYSNQASPATLGSLVRVHAVNTSFNQPTVYIRNDGTTSETPTIRFDAPTPTLTFVETDQSTPAGKYVIDVASDVFRLTGRNAADSQFDAIITAQRIDKGGVGAGGQVGINTSGPAHSTLQVNGSYASAVVTKTSNYIATHTEQTILVNASSNGVSITLPTAASIGGRTYNIQKIDASTNLVSIVSTDSVVNLPILHLTSKGQAQTLVSDGTSNWHSVGPIAYTPPYIGYTHPSNSLATVSLSVASGAFTVAIPVTVPVTVTKVRVGMFAATGNVDVGVYDSNGNRVASSGPKPVSGDGMSSFPLSGNAVLNPGTYYLAVAADNTTTMFSAATSFGSVGNPSLAGGCFSSAYPLPAVLGGFPGTANPQPPLLMGIVNGGVSL